MSEPTDIRDKQADAIEAASQAMRDAAPAMVDAMTPLKAAMGDSFKDVREWLAEIGLQQGVSLGVAGTHLGSFVGGGFDMRLSVTRWVDALMHLYLRGSLPIDEMIAPMGHPLRPDQLDYCESSQQIVRAALEVLEGQISLKVPDVALAMRKYLTLMVSMILEGSAQIEAIAGNAQGQRIDD